MEVEEGPLGSAKTYDKSRDQRRQYEKGFGCCGSDKHTVDTVSLQEDVLRHQRGRLKLGSLCACMEVQYRKVSNWG